MISLKIIFWGLVLFFGLIGYLRGWQKEVIAMAGMVASLALLQQFGVTLVSLIGNASNMPPGCAGDPNIQCTQEFWIQAVFHSLLAFFSYQMVVRLADQVTAGRFGDRLRKSLEKQIIGALVGFVNGYLLVGGLWGFLEYQLGPNGYQRLEQGVDAFGQCIRPYVFDSSVVIRPVEACMIATTDAAQSIIDFLPMGILSPQIWLLIFFGIFILMIVALI